MTGYVFRWFEERTPGGWISAGFRAEFVVDPMEYRWLWELEGPR